MLERADRGVGKILATLRSAGLERNTIVIFTNDNGGEWLSRNAPLFNRKDTVWEGGIRVPSIMRWPGRIPAGPSPAAGRDHDGPDGDDPRARRARVVPPEALEGIHLMPIADGGRRVSSGRCIRRRRRPAPAARRPAGRLEAVVEDGGLMFLYNVRHGSGRAPRMLAEPRPDLVSGRLQMLVTAWEKDVDEEAKGAGKK